MNKIRKWLIHKLGGVAEISPSLPYERYITYNFTPVKFGYTRIAPEHIPPNIIKEEIARCLAKEMLDKGFIKIKSTNMPESQADPPKNGKYNISIYEGGKVVITTKIQYILTDNNKLIIYGIPVHEPIE